jgi:hypothetical protein
MKIYRFYKLDEKLIKFLNDMKIYFASPLVFNDPFDCDLACIGFGDNHRRREKIEEYISDLEILLRQVIQKTKYYEIKLIDQQSDEKAFRQYYYNDFAEPFFNLIKNLFNELKKLRNIPSENIEQALKEFWAAKKEIIMKQYGIICFSKSNINILLWSHYADSHKGVCLEFDSDERPIKGWKNFKYHPVSYSDERKIDVFETGFEKAFLDLLTIKSKDWAYEEEYRLVTIKGPGYQNCRMASLTGIILGSRIRENEHSLLEQLYNSLSLTDHKRRCIQKLKHYHCEKKPLDFSIIIKPIRNVHTIQKILGLE